MLEEKETFWKKKGFYASACILLIGIMAVSAIAYRKWNTNTGSSSNKIMANIATEVPAATPAITAAPKPSATPKQKAAQVNAPVAKNDTSNGEKSAKKDRKATQAVKNTDAAQTTKTPKQTAKKAAQASAAAQTKLSFNEEAGLLWPVKGDVLLKYSMSNSVYFKTLAQYKCNPGVVISAKTGTEVKAAADCQITKIKQDDELGTVVTTDIGNNYTVSYGQLDNVSVNKGDILKEGDVIGTIAKPTKYYTEEGSNLYLQVENGKETVDPMLLLR